MYKKDEDKLPEPKCELGYTAKQVRDIVGDYDYFRTWIYGQTMGHCEGVYTDCNEEHGTAIYPQDLKRFIDSNNTDTSIYFYQKGDNDE